MDEDDQRQTEISTLEAIFPEIKKPDIGNPFTFTLLVPVRPLEPVTVSFPVGSAAGSAGQPAREDGHTDATESHELHHLPALSVRMTLPEAYPEQAPPTVSLGTTPDWVLEHVLRELEGNLVRTWEESGRELVCFAYIDYLQQEAEKVFGMADSVNVLRLDPRHRIALLDHDISEKRAEFDRNTFDCGICLDPKKGSACHKMLDCGHVFCLECLRAFYNKAIERGELGTVRCVGPNCAKERAARQSPRKGKRSGMAINPSELLQIGLSEAVVKRYVALSYKTELEADKNTVYCPRSWCSGAARSRKHRKPKGFEIAEPDSGSDGEDEGNGPVVEASAKSPRTVADQLAICEDCSFAFCSQCLQSWHGEFTYCRPPKTEADVTAEEQASIKYMELHTSPCPTCSVPVQKTYGCNHMTCPRCHTHFCYLCGAWLYPSNPYSHFNTQPNGKVTSCFGRLWELEDGDGSDIDHAGRRRAPWRAAEARVEEVQIGEDQLADDDDDVEELVYWFDPELVHDLENAVVERDERHNGQEAQRNDVGQADAGQAVGARQVVDVEHAVLAREGPLMLRLVANVPPAPPIGEAAGVAPARRGEGGRPNGGPVPVQARGGRRGQAMNRNNNNNNNRGGPRQQQPRGVDRGGQGRRPAPAAPRGGRGRGRGRGRGNAHGQQGRDGHANAGQEGPEAVLNQNQQDWVRRFVELALQDREYLMDFEPFDDGFDDDDFAIEEVP